MGLTLLAATGFVAGLNGIIKINDANDLNSEATKTLNQAYTNYYYAIAALEKDKDMLNRTLDSLGRKKVSIWGNELVKFLQIFLRYKDVKFSKSIVIDNKAIITDVSNALLYDIKNSALAANSIKKKELNLENVSIYVGIAAYGTCMLSATAGLSSLLTFANESKFVNFLGGNVSLGSLGAMNVCNIVLGPILTITGEIESAKAKANLAEAKMVAAKTSAAIENIRCIQTGLKTATSIASSYNSFLSEASEYYCDIIKKMDTIHKRYFDPSLRNEVKFDLLLPEEKEVFHIGWLFTQLIFNILTNSFIDDNGNIFENAMEQLNSLELSTKELVRLC